MITKIKNARLITPDGIKNENLYFEHGEIKEITQKELLYDNEIDAKNNYVCAGFIDIHIHGGAGYEFADATKEAVKEAANIHALHGTTTIFPTISAYDINITTNALETIKRHKDDKDILPNIAGVHLEGPYFSKKQAGAQLTEHIRDPIKQEYTNLYRYFGDIIKRWSFAPEKKGADEFLSFLNKNGIVASAGHTDAQYEDMLKAYKKGCRLITHLYSCTSSITRIGGFRHLGVIETAYLYDDIDVEIIADGCHLPPELIRLIVKIKGIEHVCAVSDAIRYGGIEGTKKVDENLLYIIEDGVAKLKDRSAFAGSIATADVLIRTLIKKAGFSVCDAVKMMTVVPARIMKLEKKGSLVKGYDADIIIFDDDINIKNVIVGGNIIK